MQSLVSETGGAAVVFYHVLDFATKAKVLENDRLPISFNIHLHPSKSVTSKRFEFGML